MDFSFNPNVYVSFGLEIISGFIRRPERRFNQGFPNTILLGLKLPVTLWALSLNTWGINL